MIQVFHGSVLEITDPLVSKGRDNLDFGKAFYVTRLRDQAENWARVVWSRHEEGDQALNVYELDDEAIRRGGYRTLEFEEYDQSWLEFIVASRLGKKPWLGYDFIEGGVANDRVIDTVEGYMAGDFSVEVAIGRLRYHRPNNQIAMLKQDIIRDHLVFIESEILPKE